MTKNLIYTISFCLFTCAVFGQNKKAIEAFEDQRFHDAMAILDKEFEDGKQNDANSYIYSMSSFYAGEYDKAITTTQTLLEKYPEKDDYKYILIRSYLAQKDYDKAKSTWNTLDPKSKEEPDIARLSNNIISQAKWDKIVTKMEVSNFDEVNTSAGDYSPFIYGEDLVFCTMNKADLINMEELDPSVKNFSKLYKKKLGQFESKNSHEFLPGLIHGKHIGPVSINKEKTEIFYTSASQLRSGVNYNDLFSIQKIEDKWSEPIPFKYNNEDYNIAHPAISDDGKTLFFSSDKPGGYGGMDLYYCFKTELGWSSPINLGDNVNTPENEVFPSYNEGYLYFSSNGHVGYGSLDMYRVEESHHWEFVENLKAPFNSPYDDFGVCFENSKSGYFTSNRPGGSGKDDIYRFESTESGPAKESQFITGIFEKDGEVLKNQRVFLVDEFGEEIQEAYTNAEGEFFFLKEKGVSNYSIQLDKNVEEFKDVALLLTDSNGDVTEIIEADENGGFNFEILGLDDFDNLALMEQSDDDFLSISIKGQVFQDEYGDLQGNEEVSIINQYGIVIDKTMTDEEGNFIFEQLKPDDLYIFKLSNNDEALKIAIFDSEGKPVQIIIGNKDMRYYFERLSADDEYISLINSEDQEIYIKANETFVINNIYYDFNSAELNNEAKSELSKLITVLHNNPHVSIDITSHTDSRATDKYNLKLSQNRADGVAAFLISNGINAKRLEAIGMGEFQLVNHCSNDADCTKEEHAKNRRTEISIKKNQNF